jgi:zinc transport system ATP-binding protein
LGELSGGELQRILLSCAIAHDPEMLLLDEPDAGIDAEGLTLFYNLVSDLRSRLHVSIVLVTHDLPGITPYTDRMLLLNRTVLAEGEPHEVLANEALIRQLTPALWNISRLPSMAGTLPSPSPADINGGK